MINGVKDEFNCIFLCNFDKNCNRTKTMYLKTFIHTIKIHW